MDGTCTNFVDHLTWLVSVKTAAHLTSLMTRDKKIRIPTLARHVLQNVVPVVQTTRFRPKTVKTSPGTRATCFEKTHIVMEKTTFWPKTCEETGQNITRRPSGTF
jgi:hypothetical protein